MKEVVSGQCQASVSASISWRRIERVETASCAAVESDVESNHPEVDFVRFAGTDTGTDNSLCLKQVSSWSLTIPTACMKE